MPSFLVIFMCVFYVCLLCLQVLALNNGFRSEQVKKTRHVEATNKQTATCGGQSIAGTIAMRILRMNRACGGAVMWKKI
jgi:hypothetical protein